MLVIADTSALVALAACNGLPLLDALFDAVRIPPAVLRECAVSGKPEAERLEGYLRPRVVNVDLTEFVIAVTGLGQGELEAMALYKRLHADRLLVDDFRARKIARLNGIEVIGSLGVLLLAKQEGLIARIRPALDEIQAAGSHLSEALVAETLRIAGGGVDRNCLREMAHRPRSLCERTSLDLPWQDARRAYPRAAALKLFRDSHIYRGERWTGTTGGGS